MYLAKTWLDLQLNLNNAIKKPDELEKEMQDPPTAIDQLILDRVHGSLIGLALGDALGAHVEFRPHTYLLANPVTGLEGGGTWGLSKGQVWCLYRTIYILDKFSTTKSIDLHLMCMKT